MGWITGVGLTPFGRREGETAASLMAAAAKEAAAAAGLRLGQVDGLLCGYATTMPHLMLSTVLAEYLGMRPAYAHGVQLGGATGCALVMLADLLVEARRCEHILVVAGENRLTGQSRDAAVQTLAQVGHPELEVPYGATIPAYYALVASRYMHVHGLGEADLAPFAVLMRRNGAAHPDAHIRQPVDVAEVLASKPIASPLKLLDCCPISDGGAALIVSRERRDVPAVRIASSGQAHSHQHVSFADDLVHFGADRAASGALERAGLDLAAIDLALVYDSFTITLLILLEEIGFAPRGQAAAAAHDGVFDPGGSRPLNPHGGLLAYGHAGVAGGMAHIVEACRQLTGTAKGVRLPRASAALVHGDGGVLSSHVSLVLTA